MKIGINYPWFDYGWDFGDAPPNWRDSQDGTPNWAVPTNKDNIDNHLQFLVSQGISVVRWFVLADGLTYGTGQSAPKLDSKSGQWHFDPPELNPDQGILYDFRVLLEKFLAVNSRCSDGPLIQLLPVFMDFNFCFPGLWPVGFNDENAKACFTDPGWVKQGRAEVITDSKKQKKFLDSALVPLLELSGDKKYRKLIYAWDIFNEPEMVTDFYGNNRFGQPIDPYAMAYFLQLARDDYIQSEKYHFDATIGFMKSGTASRTGLYCNKNQFHHYSGGCDDLNNKKPPVALRKVNPQKDYKYILGEFATVSGSNVDEWPELPKDQSVYSRLKKAKEYNYDLVLPWCFRPNPKGVYDKYSNRFNAMDGISKYNQNPCK